MSKTTKTKLRLNSLGIKILCKKTHEYSLDQNTSIEMNLIPDCPKPVTLMKNHQLNSNDILFFCLIILGAVLSKKRLVKKNTAKFCGKQRQDN